MTDTDRLVVWLRAAMDAAEQLAQAAAWIEEPWRAVDTHCGPEVRIGDDDSDDKWSRESLGVDAAYRCDDPYDDCGERRAMYLNEAKLIAAHASPAAVLRRIAADRKTLDECAKILAMDPNGWEYDDAPNLAETVIHNLAEGWGWTEETP